MAILNLYQLFLEKLSEIIWNSHFFPFWIYTSLFGEELSDKIWKGNSWPFWIYTNLFGKSCQKNSEQPFLTILNLYKSFWEKLSRKIWNGYFCHSEFIPVFLGKIVSKNLEMAIFGYSASLFGKNVRKNLEEQFLAILNLYKSFWRKLSEIIWNGNFWPFWIYTSLFRKNCQK